MKPKAAVVVLSLGMVAILWASGVAPAIVPALVPTANKTGNSSLFQLQSGTHPVGDCPTWDASGNLVTSGVSTCGGGGGSVSAVTGTPPIHSSGGGAPDITIDNFTGDSGSGGAKGAVPAPASGDSTAGKFLAAGGGWSVPGGAVPTNLLQSFRGVSGNPFASPLYAGCQIQTGFSHLTATGMGRVMISGNVQTHNLKIVDAGGTDVAGATCNAAMSGVTAGTIKYCTFASPVALTANTLYFALSQEFAGNDVMYDDTLLTGTNPFVAVLKSSAWVNSNGPAAPNLNTAGKSYVGVDVTFQ